MTNEITIYEEAWEAEEAKDKCNQMTLYSLGKKGLERSIELNYRKYASNYLTKLIGLADNYPGRVQFSNEADGWRVMRIQQYVLLKDGQRAKAELARLDSSI